MPLPETLALRPLAEPHMRARPRHASDAAEGETASSAGPPDESAAANPDLNQPDIDRDRRLAILVITPSLPHPPIWGFGTRVYQLIRHLSARHSVTLLTFGTPSDQPRVDALLAVCDAVHKVPPVHPEGDSRRRAQLAALFSRRSYLHRRLHSRVMQEALDRLLAQNHFDLIQVESAPMMAALRLPEDVPVLLDEHNIEYELLHRTFREETSPLRKAYNWLEYVKCRREEERCWQRATACVFTSDREVVSFRREQPAKPVSVVPNGVDLDYFQPEPTADARSGESIVFTGLMRYRPNVDAVTYFVREILPRVLHERPAAQFVIVGAAPSDEVRRLAGPNVVVTGQVPDIRPYVAGAAAVVVPLRMGSGTRLKVLEALAMGKAIVSTSLGCEGLEVNSEQHLLLADDSKSFAQCVVQLLNDASVRRQYGHQGRQLAETTYGWSGVSRALERFCIEHVVPVSSLKSPVPFSRAGPSRVTHDVAVSRVARDHARAAFKTVARYFWPIAGTAILLFLTRHAYQLAEPMPAVPAMFSVVLSARYGGIRPGLLAAALGAIVLGWAYLPISGVTSASTSGIASLALLGVFILVAAAVSVFGAYVDQGRALADLKQLAPRTVRRALRRVSGVAASVVNRFRVAEIDLRTTLIGGYHSFDASQWAEFTDQPALASTLLPYSPHVQLLEQFNALGQDLFRPHHLERTTYFHNALECIRLAGDYFGYTTRDGIAAQSRAFVELYERVRAGDNTEVKFEFPHAHSGAGSLPVVHATWAPGVHQIVHGHHRLAIEWVLGRERVRAVVLSPRPTTLQRLAMSVQQTKGLRELYQPIASAEFDSSWRLTRRCQDRFDMMTRFLRERGVSPAGRSVVDLACSYGWFVAEFGKLGYDALGVEPDPTAIKIGRIAYRLPRTALVHSTLQGFAEVTRKRFDVVLCLSILHHFALNPGRGRVEDLLARIDALAGTVLFIDFGQAHERWFAKTLPQWTDDYLIRLIKAHTTFDDVIKLGTDSDSTGPYRDNYRRSLFACVRS